MTYIVTAQYREKKHLQDDVVYPKTFGPFGSRQQADICAANLSSHATCMGATVEQVPEAPMANSRYLPIRRPS